MNRWLLLILVVFGVFFIGQGITGFYLLDFEQTSCVTDDDCGPKVCCMFFEEDYGVCDFEEKCTAIERVTMEEKQKISELDMDEINIENTEARLTQAANLETPKKTDSQSIIIGVVLLLFSLIAYYTEKDV